jgi:hypothetical protein
MTVISNRKDKYITESRVWMSCERFEKVIKVLGRNGLKIPGKLFTTMAV